MLNQSPIFTVFTPTYNRAHTIDRVFKSLKSQTFRDFEWVVIDDGSSDNTAEIIKCWQHEVDFKIIYQYQPNSGKHVAFNRAVAMARGELFLVIDSDDGFLSNSLESMLKWWMDIPEHERGQFTGVVTLCQYEDGNICGQPFSICPLDTNSLDLRFKYKARGETWGFHRTKILKAYPFPEDEAVRFIPENLIWDDIARKYKIRCINEPLRIFYQDSGNQVTKAEPRKKALVKNYFLQILNRDFDYFLNDPKTFAKWSVLYVRYSLHLRDWSCLNPNRFSRVGAFFLCSLALIPASLVYLRDIAVAGNR
ncbi:MAG: glycosyltransferase family A protein [Methylotenera sp.]|nr:glycosyltransferase family A protein [Methylotenera sp.]MDP2404399.1 glycosyltransferase family A protein [Methylotenera sp.]MDZ4222306.1 glycosyltransferase family A protein [Methylotenera sp.]